ncbi:hypothetical protein AHAT_28790 [Agarivorans sp. Toyoura001]|uniref:hypothetical protein n=1 Tax=Agarivorans sp. Toyoura001 TaxID=2283141 RepID=UPI0010D54319|nr:hypothetical protein [Agarivorans sp. Toyoura001]GDY26989.1 hypothetical protein AHAT_28790 [Agarivorans sp. Toyoura001]
MIERYRQLVNQLSPWQIALLAALVYGAWAAFVNSEHGNGVAIKAGLVQGSYAFVSTWLISFIAKWMLLRWGFSQTVRWSAMSVSWLVMLAIPVVLHTWQNTPDLVEAILPGLAIGSLYLWSYCQQLQAPKPE